MGESLWAPDADEEEQGPAPGLGTEEPAPEPIDVPKPATDDGDIKPNPAAYQAAMDAAKQPDTNALAQTAAPADPWQDFFSKQQADPWQSFFQSHVEPPSAADLSDTPMPGAQAVQSVRKIGNAFVDGLGDGWTGGALVTPGMGPMFPAGEEALRRWTSYPEVDKAQKGVWQAFNESFLFPAVRLLAETADSNLRRGLSVAQVPLQAGSALLRGTTEAVAQTGEEVGQPQLGRDIAAYVEREAIGGGDALIPHVPEAAVAREPGLPVEPAPHPAVAEFRTEPFPEASAPRVTPEARVLITPDIIQTAREQGVIGTQAEWDGTSVYSSVKDETPPPLDIHAVARQVDPDTFEEYDRLRATHDLDLQEFRDELQRAQSEVIAKAPHAEEIADLQETLNDPRSSARSQRRAQARLAEIQPEHDAYLASDNSDLVNLVLASPENMQLRNQLADNAQRMDALGPQVRAAYAEAQRRMPPEEAAPATTEAVTPEHPSPPVPVSSEAAPAPPAEVSRGEPTVAPVDITANVAERMKAAGRPEAEANATGALINAYYETKAARFGGAKGSAADLYRAEAPRITGRETGLRGASGSLSQVNGQSVLTLFRKADPSTAVHELGHFWTNDLLRDGADPAAPEGLKADAQAVRNWLGVPEDAPLSRNQHERMARAFETYIREGRAPSSRLADVFNQFKDWMAKVYETLKDRRVNINDDIRGVFDRWFAETPERAVVAPEDTGPPRVRTMQQIMAEDRLSPAKAQARNLEEVVALADWQRDHPEAVAAMREARAGRARATPSAPAESLAATGEAPLQAGPSTETGMESPRPQTPEPSEALVRSSSSIPPANENALPTPTPLQAYQKVPREPKRLVQFLKEGVRVNEGSAAERIVMHGLRDESGEIDAIIGGPKGRPGLINNRDGEPLDHARERAVEAGYLPAHADIEALKNALRADHEGHPVYSDYDREAITAYEQAIQHNQAIDRMAAESGVDPKGLTLDEFIKQAEGKLSPEEFDREELVQHARIVDSANELRDDLTDWEGPAQTEATDALSLDDLERSWRQSESAASVVAGPEGRGEPGVSGGPAPEGQANGGRGGAGAADAGSTGQGGKTAAGEGAAAKPRPFPVTEPSAALADGLKQRRDEIPKIGNVRLEYIDQERWDELVRDVVGQLELSGDPRVREGSVKAMAMHAIFNESLDGWDKARQTWQKSPTPDNLIELEQAKGRAAVASENLSAGLTDWGKTGNQWQKIIRESKRRAAEMTAGVDDMTLFQRQAELALDGSVNTPEQLGKKLRDDYVRMWDKAEKGLVASFIQAILSNPITHGGYLIGTNIWNAVRGAFIPFEAAYGLGRELIQGGETMDRVLFGEMPAHYFGMVYGGMKGIAPAYRAFKTGDIMMEGLGGRGLIPHEQQILPNLLGGKIGYALETPGRVIAAIHVFNYSVAYSAEMSRMAYRAASEKLGAGNITYEQFGAEVQRYFNDPPPNAMDYAHDQAIRSVLMKRPAQGTFQGKVGNLLSSHPALRLLAPFPQIGMNLAEEGLVRTTPAGLLSKTVRADLAGARGGAAGDIAAGSMLAGSAIATVAVGAAMQGLITGPGPDRSTEDGRKKAALLEAQGWAPYSIRFGNTYIPYRKALGPLGELLGMSATMADAGRAYSNDQMSEAASRLTQGFREVVIDETWFRTMHDVGEAVSNPEAKPYVLRNLVTSFVPFSGALRGINSQPLVGGDEDRRRVTNLGEAFQAMIPGQSEKLHPQIGPWGQPVLSHSTMGPHFLQGDPVSQRMIELGMGVKPFEHKIKTVEMDEAEYERYGRLAGTLAHQMLLPMVSAPGFSTMPRGMQMKQIESRISIARANAEKVIQAENPQKFIVGAMMNKQKMLTEGRGSPVPYMH